MILSSESKYPVHATAESSAILEALCVQEVPGQGFAGMIVTHRSRRQLQVRFTTRVSERKSGEEVLA